MIATVIHSSLGEEDNIEQFGVELNQMIQGHGSYWLVLDLHQVKMMTSSAVGKLIGLHRNLHRRDGRLALCGVTGMIRDVLQSAKLIDYFHVDATVDQAVNRLTKVSTAQESSVESA